MLWLLLNNRVFKQLQQDVPYLILVKCNCHSLQLAVSEASKHTIPRKLKFLIRETYDWFSKSSSKQNNYKTLYGTLNDGQEPSKIVQASQTRLLSVEVAVNRIVNLWLEHKTHFQLTRISERCSLAEELYGLYKDDQNFVLLRFLGQVLKWFKMLISFSKPKTLIQRNYVPN